MPADLPYSVTDAGARDRANRAPSRFEAAARALVLARLRTWPHGGLVFDLPDGSQCEIGAAPEPHPRVVVHDWAFFARVLLDADIGAGESYARGEWDARELAAVLRVAVAAPRSAIASGFAWASALRHAPMRAWRVSRPGATARNVRSHYDLGNGFFAGFLDASMTYSAAVYPRAEATLEEAQAHKRELVFRALGLAPGMRVLDLGCGWGGLALHAAQRHGCRVTAVTLSPAQADWARARVRAAGLDGRVDVVLGDWRAVGGTFDAIASIEMLEAIGHRAYGTFFATCGRLLVPGGRLALQVIAYPEGDHRRYRWQYDFLRKHVFAGGVLPTVPGLLRAARRAGFRPESVTEGRSDYACTLAEWRRRLGRADGPTSPRLRRTWEFYLAACEAGFATGRLSSVRMVLAR
jgi:cyclopropane-fatty-acyl-phospholipid synthase